MTMTFGGQEYHVMMGSDVVRDGMYIEITAGPRGTDAVLEVFYSDVRHDMVVTLFAANLPVEVVEWAISVARDRLPVAPDPKE